MDWLRRNWPDLLIGLALVAVIAGIIATLISGGSFFPAGSRTAEGAGQDTTPLTAPAAAGAQSNQVNSEDGAAEAGLGAADSNDANAAAAGSAAGAAAAGSAGSVTATPDAVDVAAAAANDDASAASAGDAGAPAAQSGAGLPVAVLPPAGQPSAGQSASAVTSSAQDSATPPSSSVSSTPASGATSADSGIDIPASGNSEAPYRVSVGAYANRANAEGQAATFRAAGYPVFIGEQGNLNIVLVGPYDSESEARSVAAGIRNGDFGVADPTVYEFTGDDDDQAVAQAPAASSVSSTEASRPAAQPGSEAVVANDDTVITSSPVAAAGVRYLQAGAYGTRDSSLPQRERLEGLGFVVTERVENDLVKLLIGPFDAANLENAEGRLEAAGIASFPR